MIHHSVVFTFRSSIDEEAKQQFFIASNKLAAIEGVEDFKCHKQVSPKNKYQFGISMDFASEALYKQYNDHPMHTKFIQENWLPCVDDFMEIDYLPYE